MRWLVMVSLLLCPVAQAETFVVAAGVEAYEDQRITPLKYAAPDAKSIGAAFRAAGVPPRNVVVLTSDETAAARRPTRINLLRALRDVSANATPADRLVLFFAGHGIEQEGEQYLLTVDAQLDLVTDTALPLSLVTKALQGLRATEVLFLLDACRNDPTKGRGDVDASLAEGLARGLRPVLPAAANTQPLRVASILACAAGQRAWEDPERGHGVFTLGLLRGLAGAAASPDGQVHLRGLFAFVEREVAAWCQRAGRQQTPLLVAPDDFDLALLKPPAEPVVSVVFERRPLGQAVVWFAEQYGVQLVLGPGVDPALTLTGRLSDQPLTAALKVLTLAHGLQVKRDGTVYLLSRQGATAPGAFDPSRIHVATDGKDTNPGTADAPVATIQRARDLIREVKQQGGLPQGGVTVELRGGIYELAAPLELGAGDAGTAEAPILYRNRGNEEVRLVGGRVIRDWQPVSDATVLARLPAESRSLVRVADLRASGLTDYGVLGEMGFGLQCTGMPLELFFQGRAMTLARWPNTGYARVASLPAAADGRTFVADDARVATWAREPEALVCGFWFFDWADSYHRVERLDAPTRTITAAGKTRYGLRQGARWFGLNLLCELDTPGEYYLDRQTGRLYFWPPTALDRGAPLVSLLDQLLIVTKAPYVSFQGLTFEACRRIALTINGADHNDVRGCTIRNAGEDALVLAGRDSTVSDCDVTGCGGGGVALTGGDRATLTPAGLSVTNCHLHHLNRWLRTYRPAIALHGCGIEVRRNLIHDLPHSAIQFYGNEHRIALNELRDLCTDTDDVGAIYTGRDWTARGTVIEDNLIARVQPVKGGSAGARAVYLDDFACGIAVRRNVFVADFDGVFLHGGRDHRIDNNLFIDCQTAIRMGMSASDWDQRAQEPNGALRKALTAMPYQSELWRQRYPSLAGILEDEPARPKGNRILRNLCVRGAWLAMGPPFEGLVTVADNLQVADDPGFVHAASGNYQLRPDSRVFREVKGFEPIPFDQIGLQLTELRKELPAPE